MKKKLLGRPLNLKKIIRVKQLREKDLSFREIAKLVEADVKTVFRWSNYRVGKIVDKSV